MADDNTKAPVIENTETAQASASPSAPAPSTPKKKKNKRTVAKGQVHVLATFNNTIITVSDEKGNVLSYSSAGACGFRGSKKGTAYAAQVAAEKAIVQAKSQFGFRSCEVFIKGIGLGRDAAVRVLGTQDVQVESISDVTGIPHGGTRPPKARRV